MSVWRGEWAAASKETCIHKAGFWGLKLFCHPCEIWVDGSVWEFLNLTVTVSCVTLNKSLNLLSSWFLCCKLRIVAPHDVRCKLLTISYVYVIIPRVFLIAPYGCITVSYI